MALTFIVSDIIPAAKEAIYNAWLDGSRHAAMTGARNATASTAIGDVFTAHDDYITGVNIDLAPYSKIVQQWRTTDFSDDEENSLITVTFEDTDGGTLITLVHSNLPPHGMQYESGWKAYYFEPMKKYFGGQRLETRD